ncbi:MAG: flagellar hook assembly protein FlgD [Candidatus Nitrohelix vancouverensis]|uniref:Basal-body rod modification protein FlgD n=1 Tax=Candidatus Nitrohelix vancouverensis TaxID=2705534 RepID=A0A7T0G395_9BACT|nr:MAG: flagellar hook assembly protein FlgD [Candidatus Nitrohelix vancouverensis]
MIAGLNPIPANNSASQLTGAESKEMGKTDFLQLLIAQLSAQDPLNPLEGQEFTAQLAQFSSLEQMSNVNKNLEEIQDFNVALYNSSLFNLIGKSVNAPGNSFDHTAGAPENLSYSLGSSADTVKIDIFDHTGLKVDSITLNNQNAGLQSVGWDGTDSEGQPLPNGTYTFNISAEDLGGNFVSAELFTSGKVTDVIFEGKQSFAVVNGEKLLVDEITKVSEN